jgi:hypothetical protein
MSSPDSTTARPSTAAIRPKGNGAGAGSTEDWCHREASQ